MKKIFYLIPLVGMLMVSCKSDEPVATDDGNNRGEVHNSYLTVNIHPTSGYGTRADNTVDGGTYRPGNESEQKVNSIRFFFFDDKGEGAPVSVFTQDGQPDKSLSYIDWDNPTLGASDLDHTVEATVSATLGLFIPDEANEPQSMIAIINPSPAVKAMTGSGTYGPSKSDVQDLEADFESGLTDGNFVMSNSVYAAVSPIEAVNYTSLIPEAGKPSYFQSSVEAAQANPVIVWVERVAARLDLSIDITNFSNSEPITATNGEILYPVMKKVSGTTENASHDDIQATVNDNGVTKKVYVKFLGWNVTSTPDKSFLVKLINPNWTTEGLFGATTPIWNTADYHRSFWAMNPELADNNYQYGNFNGKADPTTNPRPAKALDIPAAGKYTTTYMQENASQYDFPGLAASAPLKPTQVIIAAQLVDENNNPIELAEWAYEKYTQSDLLVYLVNNIISNGNFYKKTNDGYASLQAEDLYYMSAQTKYPDAATRPKDVEDYYSYVQLKPDQEGAETEWYIKNTDGEEPTYTKTSADYINEYILNSVGYTMSWYNGYTYYYFDVRHLGQPNSPGYNGVVRNHLYEAVVKTLYGYGTPVPNPDEIIIPQTPEYEEILLSAEIRILEWRVVHTEYDLEWK